MFGKSEESADSKQVFRKVATGFRLKNLQRKDSGQMQHGFAHANSTGAKRAGAKRFSMQDRATDRDGPVGGSPLCRGPAIWYDVETTPK